MKRFLCLTAVLAVFLLPALVFAVTADSIVGSWGYVMIKHNNDSTWNSRAGSLTFKSDGTGIDSYANNANGTQGSGTENFNYSATVNGGGSLTVVYSYTNRTVVHRYVLSDDGKNLIGRPIYATFENYGQNEYVRLQQCGPERRLLCHGL